MGKVLFFLLGLVTGVVVAQQLARTPQGGRVIAAVNDGAGEFAQAVADSYRAASADKAA